MSLALLAAGADGSLTTKFGGCTPYMLMARRGSKTCLASVLRHASDTEAVEDVAGRTREILDSRESIDTWLYEAGLPEARRLVALALDCDKALLRDEMGNLPTHDLDAMYLAPTSAFTVQGFDLLRSYMAITPGVQVSEATIAALQQESLSRLAGHVRRWRSARRRRSSLAHQEALVSTFWQMIGGGQQ